MVRHAVFLGLLFLCMKVRCRIISIAARMQQRSNHTDYNYSLLIAHQGCHEYNNTVLNVYDY